jgi:ATP-dependent Clp protease protease subunit
LPTIRISVVGQIQPNIVETVINGISAAKNQNRDPASEPLTIELFVNSWGGDVGSSFAVYNLLRASGLPITSYNLGEVSSAAIAIFLAGDERFASKFSVFKFHPMTWDFAASGVHAAARINDVNASIETLHGLQSDLYQERTTMTAAEIASFCLKTACFRSADAIQRGIIKAIKEPPFS